jgi:hypothetical protein
MKNEKGIGTKVSLGLFGCLATFGALACQPVTEVPARLSNGVYCLTFDVGVGGQAAFIVGDDAVLDCDGHRVTDLDSTYTGIDVQGANAVVRNCVVEGFTNAISVSPGADYFRVLDNVILSPRTHGILASAGQGVISGNVVSSSGVDAGHEWLIESQGVTDIADNVILAAEAPVTASSGARYGITTRSNAGGTVARNTVRNVFPSAGNQGIAIHADRGYPLLYRNVMTAGPERGDIGMFCYGGDAFSLLNTVVGYPDVVGGCVH